MERTKEYLNQIEMGKRIREVRIKSCMTVERFAEVLMVSDQAVYKWQRGQTTPDILKIAQISEEFHVSTDFLIKGVRGDDDELSPLSFCIKTKPQVQ